MPASPVEHLPIFVYGTLQRGEEREPLWPASPEKIEEATTRGRLFDLGPYPALVDGDDIVKGELWFIKSEDINKTLNVLDEIECYGNDDVDLYVRRIVECESAGGGPPHRAYTYFFANPHELSDVRQVSPSGDGTCRWSRNSILP